MPLLPPARRRLVRFCLVCAVFAALGVLLGVTFAPIVREGRAALPLLGQTSVKWVLCAVLCQFAVYVAVGGILRTGLSASGSEPANLPPPVSPGFLLLSGGAFLWANRALPGPAVAGLATLVFLFRRKNIPPASAQAVAAVFYFADYAAFFMLGAVLLVFLGTMGKLDFVPPFVLWAGAGVIAVGAFGAWFLLGTQRGEAGAHRVVSVLACRISFLRQPAAQNAVGDFYTRWKNIKSGRRSLLIATVWAGLMHCAEVGTVFCAVCAFSGKPNALVAASAGAGYVTGNLAALVSFLPGGLGLFEGAMGASLHFVGGLSPAQAGLATLLYRLLSVGLPLPFVLHIAQQAVASATESHVQKTPPTPQK